jgi:probable rRNA maturation factor
VNPRLQLFDRQRSVPVPLGRLEAAARSALPRVLKTRGPGDPVLGGLGSVEITVLGDRAMAAVHRRFLGIAGPTDVITFPRGEILIGAGEAVRNARRFKEPVSRELFRYLVHGLLHLQGFLDGHSRQAAAMHRVQERIVAAAWR